VERSLIQERTKESVEHRRRTGGNLGGRPKTSDKKERLVIRLREEGESYRSIRDQTGLSLATVQRILKDHASPVAVCSNAQNPHPVPRPGGCVETLHHQTSPLRYAKRDSFYHAKARHFWCCCIGCTC
jgi:hypothetical protein